MRDLGQRQFEYTIKRAANHFVCKQNHHLLNLFTPRIYFVVIILNYCITLCRGEPECLTHFAPSPLLFYTIAASIAS
jgi:hypothetical protein